MKNDAVPCCSVPGSATNNASSSLSYFLNYLFVDDSIFFNAASNFIDLKVMTTIQEMKMIFAESTKRYTVA
jgi:hypothetical protein